MNEDKDAYERLPKDLREAVERNGQRNGLAPHQVHDEYLKAQAVLNPGSPLWRNPIHRHRRRKGA